MFTHCSIYLFFSLAQAQEKTIDDLWKLVKEDVKEEEDDGFGIPDAKKKQKAPKKVSKKVTISKLKK